jgi:hypothetical protein
VHAGYFIDAEVVHARGWEATPLTSQSIDKRRDNFAEECLQDFYL